VLRSRHHVDSSTIIYTYHIHSHHSAYHKFPREENNLMENRSVSSANKHGFYFFKMSACRKYFSASSRKGGQVVTNCNENMPPSWMPRNVKLQLQNAPVPSSLPSPTLRTLTVSDTRRIRSCFFQKSVFARTPFHAFALNVFPE